MHIFPQSQTSAYVSTQSWYIVDDDIMYIYIVKQASEYAFVQC